MQRIGKDLQCMFLPTIIDFQRTTARIELHEPIRRDIALECSDEWEGTSSNFYNFFFDDQYAGFDGTHPEGVYRMYYSTGFLIVPGKPVRKPASRLCYAESADGIHWVKPILGISEIEGSTQNNIIEIDDEHMHFETLMVFRDDNPACPPDRKYKGISPQTDPHRLDAFFSADGIRFTPGCTITREGYFDSLNTVFWDTAAGIYRCYFRSFHDPKALPEERFSYQRIRDILYTESEDFEHWSKPVPLSFMGAQDCQLYTNVIMPYYRNPKLYIGFPTRYNGRREWTETYDELCGKEIRLTKMDKMTRIGLAITDCVLIASEDGKNFLRHESAFFRPGPENGINWIYGDCYPARGFARTPSHIPGAPDEISMYLHAGNRSGDTPRLWRYTLREDGFASLHADGEREEIVYTDDFIYDGEELYANFSTSAMGYLYFTLYGDDQYVYESAEIFGDAVDRRISFKNPGVVKTLAGRRVRLIIRMRDADLYSFRFGDREASGSGEED